VPLVLVADLFNNLSVFGLITGGVECADKNVRLWMAEVIEFYVQPWLFILKVVRAGVLQRSAITAKIGWALQHLQHREVDMVTARIRFQGKPDRDPPFFA